ncbi:MAG: TIGR02391 family protein [Nitrososphaerales archaeon]
MPDRATIISNMIQFCAHSPKKIAVLKCVRKPKHYEEVAKLIHADPSYCSDILNQMKAHEFVEAVAGKRGYFRQTAMMRTIQIDSELSKSDTHPAVEKPKDSEIVREVVRIFEIEKAVDLLNVDSAIRKDCFPLRRPYRKDVGEAYLTLENTLRQELDLPRNLVGVKLVSEAARKGLFNRDVESERSGLIQLFNGAFEWFRNTSHHTKEEISKEEALKMILFADHLIKLLRRLKEDAQETQESTLVAQGN